jgi:hypothetical protein
LPVVLLLAEVALLTPLVEFDRGPMRWVANARVCAAILFGAAAFMLLGGRALAGVLRQSCTPSWPRLAGALAVHLGLFGAFAGFTLLSAGRDGSLLPGWWDAVCWSVLAAGVAWTASLPFLPADFGPRLCRACPGFLLASVALAVMFAVLSPWAHGLWLRYYQPALALDRLLLEWTYGDAVTGTYDGYPRYGTSRLAIHVTGPCAEMDALLVWSLLWAATLWARWPQLSKFRMVLCLVGGLELLYGLIALRLYALFVVCERWTPQAGVSLAHSRVSGIGFLALSLALLAVSCRWSRRPVPGAAGETHSARGHAGPAVVVS